MKADYEALQTLFAGVVNGTVGGVTFPASEDEGVNGVIADIQSYNALANDYTLQLQNIMKVLEK